MVKTSDILLIIINILFPPATAIILCGCCSCDFLINVCLTLLGALPGHLHGFWLIYKKMQAEERFGSGGYKYTGNGEYVAIGPDIPNQAPPAYGSVV